MLDSYELDISRPVREPGPNPCAAPYLPDAVVIAHKLQAASTVIEVTLPPVVAVGIRTLMGPNGLLRSSEALECIKGVACGADAGCTVDGLEVNRHAAFHCSGIATLPPVLILRFRRDQFLGRDNCMIEYPNIFPSYEALLPGLRPPRDDAQQYRLSAVVDHIPGEGGSGAHYTADVQYVHNVWFNSNDRFVTPAADFATRTSTQ